MDRKTLNLACFLSLIGVICAGLIATVHEITTPIIEERERFEMERSLESFFPSLARFEEQVIEQEGYPHLMAIYQIYDEGDVNIGDVYELTTKGYGGIITLLIGYDTNTQTLVKLSYIGSFSETPGFGTRVKENEFLSQVIEHSAVDMEIDTLSGATITSSAVKGAIEEANTYFLNQMKEK